MQRLRSILFALAFYLDLGVILLLMLPTLIMPRAATFAMGRLWARVSLSLLHRICGLRVEYRGTHHIPAGGFIIAPKHQSALETFAILPCFQDYTFVLKRELMLIPFFGWYMRKAGQIAINRMRATAALAAVVSRARAVLAEGRPVILFPEGTRRPVGAPPEYKPGIARVYVEAAVPCLPVALNTGLFWPRRSLIRRPGTAVIEFLEPIPPGLDRRAFMALLQSRIEAASDRLAAEALSLDPSLTAGARDG